MHRLQLDDVLHRHVRAGDGLVLGAERFGVTPGLTACVVQRTYPLEPLSDAVGPRAYQLADAALEVAVPDGAQPAWLGDQIEMEARLIASTQSQMEVQRLAAEGRGQDLLDIPADFAGVALVRDDDHRRDTAVQHVLTQRDAHLVGLVRGERGTDVGADLLGRGENRSSFGIELKIVWISL